MIRFQAQIYKYQDNLLLTKEAAHTISSIICFWVRIARIMCGFSTHKLRMVDEKMYRKLHRTGMSIMGLLVHREKYTMNVVHVLNRFGWT